MFSGLELVCYSMLTSTTQPSSGLNQCKFLKLPPELRNHIYDLALVEEQPFRFPACRQSEIGPLSFKDTWLNECKSLDDRQRVVRRSVDLVKQPGVTRTCKEIRNESLSVFYGNNTFIIREHEKWEASYALLVGEKWLLAIRHKNRTLLKSLYISHQLKNRGILALIFRETNAARIEKGRALKNAAGQKLEEGMFYRIVYGRLEDVPRIASKVAT